MSCSFAYKLLNINLRGSRSTDDFTLTRSSSSETLTLIDSGCWYLCNW